MLDGITDSADSICHTLELVLRRDRFYNFRDAAKGAMRRGVVYRAGYAHIDSIVTTHKVATVIDLRTTEEVGVVRSVGADALPSTVSPVHIDILGSRIAEGILYIFA